MTGYVLAFIAGAVFVMIWNGSWFLIDDLAQRLRQPRFNQHVDQALANSREREAGR